MSVRTLAGQAEHERLQVAIHAAKLRVVGHQDIFDLAQIGLMASILEIYGPSEHGFVYAEPALLDAQVPPPDLVLAHPTLGVIVFEVKAYDLDFIEGMEAGSLKIRRHGQVSLVNPLRQAQRGMFAIKDAYEKLAPGTPRPLFHSMVALPNIAEDEWNWLGYDRCMDGRLVLFAEHLHDTAQLQAKITAFIQQARQRTGRIDPYPPNAEATLLRVFGDSAVLNDARQLVHQFEGLGAEIDRIEQAHKQLSAEQQHLSRMDTWGHPFLVRGVAGSGKSIVLANQVARTIYRHEKLHDQLALFEEHQHPLPRIGVICFNRSLVALLRDRIARAYQALTGEELPDFVTVIDLNAMLYHIGTTLGEPHFRYVRAGTAPDAEKRARKHLQQIETLRTNRPDLYETIVFDALFIDEGQDAHPEEYAVLHALMRPTPQTGERSMMIFYDDAQNVYGHPPPTWRNFSLNLAGGRAAIMEQCYRNSREIVELGLNVLLGVHAPQQVRVATRRFADIHTLQEKKLVEEIAEGWQVNFAQTAGIDPIVRGFEARVEQLDWVADAVATLLEDEQVRPEHLLILAPKANSFNHLSRRIGQLTKSKVPLRLIGGPFQQHLDELLISPDHLTLATIHAAKGYDAPIVFLVDVDQIETTVIGRALFYVGVTRAKRYLFVTGVQHPKSLLTEAMATQNPPHNH
ncbi:MAG: ATP-binding domain-containing protein [Chloroflexi bacterium]|nr:ATP-binding domain-containing protein [Chloroflexota bacterium]